MHRTLLLCLVCLLAVLSGKPVHAQLSRQVIDAGWYQGGLHNPFNTNYITGQNSGAETRSFFLFDVPDAGGAITAATLRIPRFEVWSPDASEFLDIYDVTTDLTDLVQGNGGLAAFGDLGSGVNYGSYEVLNIDGVEYIDVPLNSTAVAALNSSPGQFAFGGSLSSIDGPEDQSVFAFSLGGDPELILNPTNTPIGPYSTELHPLASSISVEVIVGDINDDGFVAAAIENIPLHGTVNASHILTEDNTGILQFDSSDLVMENISDYFVDLGILGGFTLDLTDARINLQTGIIPVTNSEFLMDNAEFLQVAIDDGEVLLDDPTGFIASLYGDDFFLSNDFGISPVSADLNNILGLGVGGAIDQGTGYFTERGEINLDIPEISFLLDTELDLDVYVRLSGAVHVAVPEPSTWCLGLLGAAGFVLLARRNKSGGRSRWLVLIVSAISLHVVASSPAAAQPPIASNWLNAVDGNWSNDSNWSSSSFPQNGVPTEDDVYKVTINVEGSPYNVIVTDDIEVSDLYVDSSDATLWHQSGTLSAEVLTVFSAGLRIGNDSLPQSGNAILETRRLQYLQNELTQGFQGVGTIRPKNDDGLEIRGTADVFTIEAGITIEPGVPDNLRSVVVSNRDELVNYGTIRSVQFARASIEAENVQNYGLIEVGGYTEINRNTDSQFTNHGTIVIKPGANFLMGGEYSVEDLGTVIDEGANWISLSGTLDNQGKSLDLQGFGWTVTPTLQGTILGGELKSSTPLAPSMPNGITLDGVTIASELTMTNRSFVRNDLMLDNTTLNLPRGATLAFGSTPQVLGGTGTILTPLGEGGGEVEILGTQLTIGENITIMRGPNPASTLELEFKENKGTIISDQPGTIEIGNYQAAQGAWVNNGLIRVEAGEVQFNGIYTLADLGTIERVGGTVVSAGTLKNQGTTLVQDASTGVWEIRGTVEGGRIETHDGLVAKLGAILDGVTFAGQGMIPIFNNNTNGSAQIKNSLTLDAAKLTLGLHRQLSISSDGPVIIDGVGEILLNGTTDSTRIQNFTGSELTFGPGVTVKTGPQGGGSISRNSLPVINHGKISAETSGQAIVLGGTLENTGVLQAINGSLLQVRVDHWTNEGQIKVDSGGVLELLAEQFENGTDGKIAGNGTIYLGRRAGPSSNVDPYSPTGLDPVATDADAFVNSGTIAPGIDGIGTLMIAGNLQLTSSSVVEIELGDVLLDEMDQLFVQGVFGLDGDLDVSLTDGFIPRLGEEFEILQGVMSGAFQNIGSEFLVDDVLFGISYKEFSVTLTALSAPVAAPLLAVPEPSSAALASIGAVCVALLTYRRRSQYTT